jgi:hypothetical protein
MCLLAVGASACAERAITPVAVYGEFMTGRRFNLATAHPVTTLSAALSYWMDCPEVPGTPYRLAAAVMSSRTRSMSVVVL